MQINCNSQEDGNSLAILQRRNVRMFLSDENALPAQIFLNLTL